MFRKLALALGATIAIGTAALIPTSASAHMHGHHHGHGDWRGGFTAFSCRVQEFVMLAAKLKRR